MSTPRQFEPKLPAIALRRLLALLTRYAGQSLMDALRSRADEALAERESWSLEEAAVMLVLADLAALGWRFKVVREVIFMIPQSVKGMLPQQAKEHVRRSLLATRAHQLAQNATQRFLALMHERRVFGDSEVSIGNLIDDGAELARLLRQHRDGDLSAVVRPYLQFVDATKNCPQTGLNLMDIWRYFRHTWALVYRPTPGRSLCALVRNAARPHHPVMAIFGMANAVFQLRDRDDWIGWTSERIVDRVETDPTHWRRFRQHALDCLEKAKENVRSDDLLKEIGRPKSIPQIVQRLEGLRYEQSQARKQQLKDDWRDHQEDAGTRARSIPKLPNGQPDWKKASETPLFKRKRAEVLADLYFALDVLDSFSTKGEDFLKAVSSQKVAERTELRWSNPRLERAFKTAVREMKKNGVATRILDVNVCGATPVYREILGGKLAAMMLFAKEVQREYVKRYSNYPSEIASTMAGRPIQRESTICVLTTTSLYGAGSSQYNRVRVGSLSWQEIGKTEGFGTLHISQGTTDVVRRLLIERQGMRTVNNRFGEGTSPLMRQLREGLTVLGFEPDDVLHHASARLVYAAELYPGAREDLTLDRENRPRFFPADEIAGDWSRRWLSMRVRNEEVLDRMAAHSAATVQEDLRHSGLYSTRQPLLGDV